MPGGRGSVNSLSDLQRALNKEDTQIQIKQLLEANSSDLDAIAVDIDSIDTKLTSTNSLLTTIAGKDFATSAKQDTQTGHLSTIAGKDFATQTTLAAINTKTPNLGQALMANSVPVAIASDQSAIPITGTVTTTISGVATEAKQDTQITSLQLIDDVIATLGSAIPTKGSLVAGSDGTNARALKTDSNGELQIDVLSSALPSGASTAANQTTANSSLSSIDTKLSTANTWLQDIDGYVSAAMDVTMSSRASEATLVDVKTSVQLIDDAIATLGSAIPTKANLISGSDGTNARAIKTDSNGELQVDVLTMPVVQVGDNGSTLSVDDGGGSITVDGTVAATQSGNWSSRTQDGSGNSVTSHSAGASRGLDVSIIDGSGNQITSFGGGTEYTEDVAAAADPIGKANILVRKDTPAAITSTDGDNVAQRGTNYGAAYVQVVNSSGAYVDSFGGGTQYTEDDASAANPVGNALLARRRDSLSTETTTDGDMTAVNSTAKGEVYVKHVDSVPVTGTFWQATQPVSAASLPLPTGASTLSEQQTQTTALQLIDDVIATLGSAIPAKGSLVAGSDGTNARALKTDSNGELQVDVLTLPSVTVGSSALPSGAATLSEQQTQTTALQLIDDTIVTDNGGFTDGSTKVGMAGYIYDEVAGTALTENDAAAARINANRSQTHVIEDGTTRGRYATVNSNGSVKTDGTVVLASGNITTQNLVPAGAATAGSAVEATITTQGMAKVQVTGVYTGPLSLQYTVDGSNWVTHATGNDAAFFNVNTGSFAFTIASGTTGIFRIPTAGAVKIRITALSAVTGTAVVTINSVAAPIPAPSSQNINQNLVGGATIGVGYGVSGSGVQRVIQSQEQTYQASTIIPLVAATTVNVPFFNIIGSASKTVRVKRISVSGMTLTAVGYYAIAVQKLSTASTAGTSTTLTGVPLDSNNNAATAVVKAYTAAPTRGTLVGTLRSFRALWQATTAAAAGTPDKYDFCFGDTPGSQALVLRGVAQEVCLVFTVALATAGTLAVNIEWTEE